MNKWFDVKNIHADMDGRFDPIRDLISTPQPGLEPAMALQEGAYLNHSSTIIGRPVAECR